VPKLASLHLGLARGHPLTATGGLTAFGGPGNNYSLHAIVAVARRLRAGARVGLVHGNGEYLTKQHALLLGALPHPRGYVGQEGLVRPAETVGPRVMEHGEGRARIETFTVEFDREGLPMKGFVIGRFEDGSRVLANTAEGDRATLATLVDPTTEAIGRTGLVSRHPDGRNLFHFPV
jgi:acetyl-CoA C-acetyltransferase